jgi:hypothetical protein
LIYAADEVIDPNSVAAAIKLIFAREDLRTIKARMERGKEAKRQAGKHVGGKLPFGVALTPDRGFCYAADAAKVEIAAKAFLSGNTSYSSLERRLDIPRTSLRCILQNPIYTGWLVIDKRRDPSSAGYVPGINGRQGYRRKIPRAPEDVIRVKVIEPGLITVAEFEEIQRIIAKKASQHHRYKSGTHALHTLFRGFLRCGMCGCPLYTGASQTMLYYYCKSRNSRERKKRTELGLEPCENAYMQRQRIENQIDEFVSVKLRDIDFLARAAAGVKRDLQKKQASQIGSSALRHKLDGLAAKRKRVIESYWDGDITKDSKDETIKALDRKIFSFEQLLHDKEGPARELEFNLATLQRALEPLLEWEFLEYDDKRQLLTALSVNIVISKYQIVEFMMTLTAGKVVRFPAPER